MDSAEIAWATKLAIMFVGTVSPPLEINNRYSLFMFSALSVDIKWGGGGGMQASHCTFSFIFFAMYPDTVAETSKLSAERHDSCICDAKMEMSFLKCCQLSVRSLFSYKSFPKIDVLFYDTGQ